PRRYLRRHLRRSHHRYSASTIFQRRRRWYRSVGTRCYQKPSSGRRRIGCGMGAILDSVIVCSLTAIAIIVTGEHLNEGADGITLATNAFATVSYGFTYVLTACIILFAFSTVLSYCYYGQVNFAYI